MTDKNTGGIEILGVIVITAESTDPPDLYLVTDDSDLNFLNDETRYDEVEDGLWTDKQTGRTLAYSDAAEIPPATIFLEAEEETIS